MTSNRTKRRLTNAAILSLAIALLAAWVHWLEGSLARTAHATGYAMYAVLLALAAYSIRKRLAALPLGSSAAWLQFHAYLGIGSAALMLWHTSGRWPNGWLEGALAMTYWATFGSGVGGLYLSRVIPQQLARTSEEFIYERIPTLRRGVLNESRRVVLGAAGKTGDTTLAEFYTTRIDPYLTTSRGAAYMLRPTSSLRRALMRELADLRRFLSEAEAAAGEKLFALVRKKDDLDFHEARQGLLKRWLFVHIALTCLLMALASMHGWMATMMRGGV